MKWRGRAASPRYRHSSSRDHLYPSFELQTPFSSFIQPRIAALGRDSLWGVELETIEEPEIVCAGFVRVPRVRSRVRSLIYTVSELTATEECFHSLQQTLTPRFYCLSRTLSRQKLCGADIRVGIQLQEVLRLVFPFSPTAPIASIARGWKSMGHGSSVKNRRARPRSFFCSALAAAAPRSRVGFMSLVVAVEVVTVGSRRAGRLSIWVIAMSAFASAISRTVSEF